MRSFQILRRLLPGLLAIAFIGAASAQSAKPRIEKAADLPRFTYKIDGKAEDVVRSPDKFAPFAAAVRRDTESVLNGYDIADKATQRAMLGLLATLDYLDGRYDASLARLDQVRALQDKPADKLLTGLRQRVMIQASRTGGDEAYRKNVAEGLRAALEPLPYPVIENDVKSAKGSFETLGETVLLGRVREVLQPIVDERGALSSDLAPAIVNARYGLVALLPVKAALVQGYGSYLVAHQTAKADIWTARDVVLQPSQVRAPVNVAVWDSGVDTALFPGQVLRDGDAPAAIGFDKYIRPSPGTLQALPGAMKGTEARIAARAKGFSDLRSNVDSKEASDLKLQLSSLTPEQYKAFVEELNLGGNFVHGTHVAGITLAGNPGARLVVARIEFGWTLKPDPCPTDELATRDEQASQAYVDFMRAHHVRVVNMSWGGDVASYEADLEECNIGKTPAERKALARTYFERNKAALTKAFSSAPEILFVTSAGNSNNDSSFIESTPASIALPNLLTVGAVDSAGEEAPFTSYGPTVKVHANGYQVESFLPGGSRVALSGTSMSSPQVANLAAKLLAVNPKLTPADLIRIIVETSENSADGRRHLVNPKKAIALATVG